MTLLEKFLSIEVNLVDQVPTEDKSFCQAEEEMFKKTLDQLASAEQTFRVHMDARNNEMITLYEDDHGRNSGIYPFIARKKHTDSENKDIPVYEALEYGWGYGVRECIRLRRQLKTYFITRISNYFIGKYHIEISKKFKDCTDDLEIDAITWLDIVEMIKTDLGGVIDFKGGAIDQCIKAFRNDIRHRTPLVKGNIVEIDRFFWWGRSGNHKIENSYREKNWDNLDAICSIFEVEEVRNNYAFMYLYGTECKFDWETPINGEKIEALKIFKNGKLQLKFKDASLAKQFMNRFQLNDL